MCGIVGYITTQNEIYEHARRGFFKYALMLDTLRGPDSTGVITVSKKFTVNRYKTISSGMKMATSPVFDTNVPNGWCSIGHNRSATVGDLTVANAHPFKFGKVSLVHNGTLSNGGKSLPTFDKSLEVDSMQIALALSSVPSKEAHTMLKMIDGDFALVWTDERDRSINMCRNRGRPLHLGFNFDKSFLCFMSDSAHLEVLTKSFFGTSANIPTIYSLDTQQHLKWKRGNLRPEVVEFDPFLRNAPPKGGMTGFPAPALTTDTTKSTTKKTSSSKGSSGGKKLKVTAKQTAKDRWAARKAERDANGTTTEPKNGSGSIINRMISPYDAIVPKANTKGMEASLDAFFNVTPNVLTSFKPEDTYDLTMGIVQVVGTVIATGWGNTDWEGCINFVNKAQAEAYMSKRWLVRAIGLTRNRSVPGCPAILCELIHTDFQKYADAQSNKEVQIFNENGRLAPDEKKSDIVKDPEGNLINRTQLEKRMEKGCINCSGELVVEDAILYEVVNNGQDIICESCKWEMQWPLASE